jgi:hypothetical protein
MSNASCWGKFKSILQWHPLLDIVMLTCFDGTYKEGIMSFIQFNYGTVSVRICTCLFMCAKRLFAVNSFQFNCQIVSGVLTFRIANLSKQTIWKVWLSSWFIIRINVFTLSWKTFNSLLFSHLLWWSSSPVWCPGQNKRIALLPIFHGCRERRLKD